MFTVNWLQKSLVVQSGQGCGCGSEKLTIVNCSLTALVAFALLAIISPVAAQDAAIKPVETSPTSTTSVTLPPGALSPVPMREILPGGLRLIVEERKKSPLTAIDIRVHVGSSRETLEENGIAHFIEHLIFKGSTAHASGEIDAEVEKMGGEISAKTTRDATQFSTVVPSAKWKETFALLAEAIRSPAFREPDIKAEAKVVAAEMAVARTDPAKNGFSRLASVVYDTADSARLPLMGTESNLASFTPEVLRAFHKKWYHPGNITVVLVGDISPEEARKFATFLFRAEGGLPVEIKADATVYAPLGRIARATPVPEMEQKGRELTTVLVAFRAPGVRKDETLPLFETLMPILANGNTGRLVERLVKKESIAFSVAADFVPGRNVSLILLTIVTRPKLAPLMEKSLLEEIGRLREDALTANETDRSAAIVLGRVAYSAQVVEERATWLATLDACAPLIDPISYTKAITAIKAPDLNRLISLYLTPLSYAVAVIGPPPPEATEEALVPSTPNNRVTEGVR